MTTLPPLPPFEHYPNAPDRVRAELLTRGWLVDGDWLVAPDRRACVMLYADQIDLYRHTGGRVTMPYALAWHCQFPHEIRDAVCVALGIAKGDA